MSHSEGAAGPHATSDADGSKSDLNSTLERLRIEPLDDPVLDSLGHDPRSGYVERYWLSILGPSAILLLRRLAAGLEVEPDGFEINPIHCAQELGLGIKGGRNGPFWRTVDRICRFGMAQLDGDRLAVRRRLPPLTRRQTQRLPEHLQRAHDRWTAQRLQQSRRSTVSRWSERHGPDIGTVAPHAQEPDVEVPAAS